MPASTALHDAIPLEPVLRRFGPFPPWPHFEADDVEAVAETLRSGKVNYWTGEEGRRFEEEFAALCQCRHGVAVANGTVALELALHAVGIGPGDDVVVTCRSFIASAACIVSRGARAVFADVDRDSQNITAESVARVLTPRTRAIIAVHLAGWPCDMDSLVRLARGRGCAVIEDCAQAHGATYKGRPVGSLGDVAAFSFCQDKIITTGGEGGMLTTNSDDIYRAAWSYKDHGKTAESVASSSPPGMFKWMHESIGTNWRLTEMQSALGRLAIRKLPRWLEARRRNAALLDAQLQGVPGLRLTVPPAEVEHSYYKYYAFVEPECLRPEWSRQRILASLTEAGIPCGSGICPEIYREQAFQHGLAAIESRRVGERRFALPCAGRLGIVADASPDACRPVGEPKELPVAAGLGRTSLMFLVHPTLNEQHMYDMAAAIRRVMHQATRESISCRAA